MNTISFAEMNSTESTIVAIATPPGIGALGIIRISGTSSLTIADELFLGKKISDQPNHSLHYGKIKNLHGKILDEAVLSIFRAPHSYTGEDVIEISCHGSQYILHEVLQNLVNLH